MRARAKSTPRRQECRQGCGRCPRRAPSSRAPRARRRVRAAPARGADAARWRRAAPPPGARYLRSASVISPWVAVIGRDQPRAAGALGERDVEAHVALAVGRDSPSSCRSISSARTASASHAAASARCGGEHGDADLERHAAVADLVPLARAIPRRAARPAAAGRRRRCPPRRPRVACRCPVWPSAESACRRVERAMPSLRQSSRSAGSRVPGGEQAQLDRRAETLDRLFEGRLRADRRKDRVLAHDGAPAARGRSQSLESALALPVGDRRSERRELDVSSVEVVGDDLLAERRTRELRRGEELARCLQRRREARQSSALVGVALEHGLERKPAARPRAGRRRSAPRARDRGSGRRRRHGSRSAATGRARRRAASRCGCRVPRRSRSARTTRPRSACRS